MSFFIVGTISLLIAFFIVKYITLIDSKKFQNLIKIFTGIIFFILSIFLLFRGFYYISGPLLAFSLWLTRLKSIYDLFNSYKNANTKEIIIDKKEAYEILGLDFNASKDDIIAAHRILIEKNHPDKGGSNYLSAKINKARDILLRGSRD